MAPPKSQRSSSRWKELFFQPLQILTNHGQNRAIQALLVGEKW